MAMRRITTGKIHPQHVLLRRLQREAFHRATPEEREHVLTENRKLKHKGGTRPLLLVKAQHPDLKHVEWILATIRRRCEDEENAA
jgi:hypothetical protein